MSKQAIFVGDIHFKPETFTGEKEKRNFFFSFLDQYFFKDDFDLLVLMGDIFDFWYEYRFYIPKDFFSILVKLDQLVEAGKKIIFLSGNHDFYLGNFFKDTIGIETIEEEKILELKKQHIYLHHGDGFAKKDYAYRMLKKILRSKLNQKVFSWLHPDLGMKIALSSSKISRENSPEKEDYDYSDFSHKFDQIIQNYPQISTMIFAHTHQSSQFKYRDKEIINVGSWQNKYHFLEYRNQEFQLKQYYGS